MPTPKRYVALLCFHEDTDDCVVSNVVLARAESILQGNPLEDMIRAQLTKGRDIPLIHSLITENQPFDEPTMCTLTLALIPEGALMPSEPQFVNQSYVISDDLTLVEAFRDLLERYMDGNTILAGYYQVTDPASS